MRTQRAFLIMKLKSFGSSQHIPEMAHRSPVESILSFKITARYGNLSVKSKNKLSKTVNTAEKVTGESQKQLCNIFDGAAHRKAKHITADTSHPLHSECELDLGPQGPAGTFTGNASFPTPYRR